MKVKLFLALMTLISVTLLESGSGQAQFGRSQVEQLADQSHGGHGSEHGGHHHHEPMEIPAGQPIPSVDLVVHPDPMSGWNLEIKLSNFRFAPEHASTAAQPGEGHAHLHINGEKITRIYGNWYYLKSLQPGRNEIMVNLSTNNHQDLVHQGEPIEDTEVIEVVASNN